jgi:FMN reductase
MIDEDDVSDLVILNGNPRAGSRTATLATALADALAAELAARGVELAGARTLELSEIVGISVTEVAVAPAHPQPDAVDAVRGARLLIVATPSYKGSYTGLLKVFLDRFPHQALAGVTAVPVAIAGSPGHVLATAADLQRVLTELGAAVPAVVEVLEAKLDDVAAVVASSVPAVADEVLGNLRRVAGVVN